MRGEDFINPGWQNSWSGHLGLWDKTATHCVRRVSPGFNRCLIFATNTDSFHGYPDPLECPDGVTRKSIALYYFTEEAQRPITHSTDYRAKPTDSLLKKAMVYADKVALRSYDIFKRHLGVSDATAGKILRKIWKF